jgi:hypothetical protein
MSTLVAVLAMSLSAQAHALDDQIAERIVRNYSRAIACQISHTSYKAVEIQQGGPDPKDLGTVYVVHWKGDIGCVGGNANITENFSVVEHRGFTSATPIVVTDYDFPELPLISVTEVSAENGLLRIVGLRYGPNDQDHPSQRVVYRLRFDGSGFVMDHR